MKLIDGIKLKGAPAEIPDCSRDDLPQFFVEMEISMVLNNVMMEMRQMVHVRLLVAIRVL